MQLDLLRSGVAGLMIAVTAIAGADTIIWTNGGGDNQWNNSDNWDLNRVPQIGDDVVFDATSTDNVSMGSTNVDIDSFTVEPGYTGNLALSVNTIRVRDLFHLNGGAFVGVRNTIICERDFMVTGGTQPGADHRFTFEGVENCTIDFGSSDWETGTVDFNPTENVMMSVNGTFRTSSFDVFGETGSTVTFSGSATAVGQSFNNTHQGGTLVVANGALIDLRISSSWGVFGAAFVQQQGTGRIRRDARGVAFTDVDGNVIPSTGPFDTLYIEVEDDDENINGQIQDTLTVTVVSETTGDTETITLTETGVFSGLFRTLSPLVVAAGAASAEDGTIQRNGDEDLLVTYTDPQDPDDTFTARMMRPVLVWDGGGADNEWETPENWNPDQLPSAYDDVLFDGTSSKDSQLSRREGYFHDLTIEAGYTGTVSVGTVQTNERYECRNITQNGGTLTFGSFSTFLLQGSFIRTAGTTNASSAFIGINGPGVTEIDSGPDPLALRSLQTGSNSATETNVRGTYNLGSGFSALGNETTRVHGTITMLPNSSNIQSASSATLVVEDGALIDGREINNLNLNGILQELGTGRVRRNAISIQFTDENGTPVTLVPQGEGVYVTLEDEDENISRLQDNTDVVVTSMSTGDSETLTLTETLITSETFRNTVALPTAAGVAVAEDGVLQQNGAEDLVATYVDNEDTDDTIMTNLLVDPLTWDGGGVDNDWFTAENWSGDVVPITTDRVIFDGTSVKNCEINDFVDVGSISIESAYTGTITITDAVATRSGFTQNGGTIDGTTPTFSCEGDFVLSGGTFNPVNPSLWLRSSGTALIDFGGIDRTFRQLSAFDGNGTNTTIRGNVLVTNVFQFSAQNGTYTIEGDLVLGTLSALLVISGTDTFIITDGSLFDFRDATTDINISGELIVEGTGIVRRNASNFVVAEIDGDPRDAQFNTDLFLFITDEDENIDGGAIQTVMVTIENNGDTETFELTETANFTGDFLSTTPFRILPGTPVAQDGIVQGLPGDTLMISYTDATDPADTLTVGVPVTPEFPTVWMIR